MAIDGGESDRMAVAANSSLTHMGRFKLERSGRLVHWDLASGIGSAFLAVMRAGLRCSSYRCCEVNPRSRGVFRANLPAIRERYPELVPDDLEQFDALHPQDLFGFVEVVREHLAALRDEELPTLITSSVPCTPSSKGGRGEGGTTAKGSLYLYVMAVAWAVYDEYRSRSLLKRDLAPFGWMYEISPTTDPRPEVVKIRKQLQEFMGQPAMIPAEERGATFRRETEVYSNLGTMEGWGALAKSPPIYPVVPLQDLLRKGERLQKWDKRFHGQPSWPNRDGAVPLAWPKWVRSKGSYQWRKELITRSIGGVSVSRYPIGVSVWKPPGYPEPILVVPSPEQCERGQGYWQGYTQQTVEKPGEEPIKLSADERRGMLGDIFSVFVASYVLDSCSRNSAVMGSQQPLQAATPSQGRQGHQMPGKDSAGASEDQYSEVLPLGHDNPAEELLGEELDLSEDAKPVLPPRSHSGLRPVPDRVPDPFEPGSEQDCKARLQLARLYKLLDTESDDPTVPEAGLSQSELSWLVQQTMVNDEARFVPGNIHRHRRIWEDYLMRTYGLEACQSNRKIRDVRRLLEKGLQAIWVPPDRPSEQKHPDHDKRREAVKRMMCKLMSPEEAEAKLNSQTPASIALPNLRSCYENTTWYDGSVTSNLEFCEAQVRDWVKQQVLWRWHWPNGMPPHCVLPMGVAMREHEKKLRLIFDARYINLWVKYVKFKYETLDDLVCSMLADGWVTVSDYKAGYNHIACPELSTYMAVQWCGEYYCFAAVPFGLSVACRVFTEINSVMFGPLRDKGLRINLYIDDRLSVTQGWRAAVRHTLMQYLLMCCMGWFVTARKCLLAPAKQAAFRGLEWDLANEKVGVPEKKMNLLIGQLDRILADVSSVTAKDIQSVSGRVAAMRPAIKLAPLLCWRLNKEAIHMVDRVATDEQTRAEVESCLKFMKAGLQRSSAAAMWRKPTGLVFAGDAGDGGGGGIVIYPLEMGFAPLQTSYTEQEQEEIKAHVLHSTRREVRNICDAYAWVAETPAAKERADEGEMLYLTDSQSAYRAVNELRTKDKETYNMVWDLWMQVMGSSFDLTVRWRPRTNPYLKAADQETRETDNSAWGLREVYFDQILQEFGLTRQDIELDPFSQKEFAKAERWYSLYSAPGSSGVDGFLMPWTRADGAKAFCFVNGPYGKLNLILRKIAQEKADCILLAPSWSGSWKGLLASLPVKATMEVKKMKEEKGQPLSLSVPSSRVGAEARAKAGMWTTHAYLIRFGRGKKRVRWA